MHDPADPSLKDFVTDEDLKSGKFVVVMRRNGKIVRDKDGKVVPRTLFQHKKIQTTVEVEEMQKEATVGSVVLSTVASWWHLQSDWQPMTRKTEPTIRR